MVYRVQKLHQRHHEIARLMALGLTNLEVAEAIGVSPQTIVNLKASPIFQTHVGRLQAYRDERVLDVKQRMEEEAGENLRVLLDIRDAEETSPHLKVRVAESLLDRAGYPKITKVQGEFLHGHVSEDTLSRIKSRRLTPSDNEAEALFTVEKE